MVNHSENFVGKNTNPKPDAKPNPNHDMFSKSALDRIHVSEFTWWRCHIQNFPVRHQPHVPLLK